MNIISWIKTWRRKAGTPLGFSSYWCTDTHDTQIHKVLAYYYRFLPVLIALFPVPKQVRPWHVLRWLLSDLKPLVVVHHKGADVVVKGRRRLKAALLLKLGNSFIPFGWTEIVGYDFGKLAKKMGKVACFFQLDDFQSWNIERMGGSLFLSIESYACWGFQAQMKFEWKWSEFRTESGIAQTQQSTLAHLWNFLAFTSFIKFRCSILMFQPRKQKLRGRLYIKCHCAALSFKRETSSCLQG